MQEEGKLNEDRHNLIQNNQSLKVGHLVEYRDPLPEYEKLVGVVIRITKIESNVYERGYLEAEVRWNSRRWNRSFSDKMSPYETSEDAARLKILS